MWLPLWNPANGPAGMVAWAEAKVAIGMDETLKNEVPEAGVYDVHLPKDWL